MKAFFAAPHFGRYWPLATDRPVAFADTTGGIADMAQAFGSG
jgi:hypothetical protein